MRWLGSIALAAVLGLLVVASASPTAAAQEGQWRFGPVDRLPVLVPRADPYEVEFVLDSCGPHPGVPDGSQITFSYDGPVFMDGAFEPESVEYQAPSSGTPFVSSSCQPSEPRAVVARTTLVLVVRSAAPAFDTVDLNLTVDIDNHGATDRFTTQVAPRIGYAGSLDVTVPTPGDTATVVSEPRNGDVPVYRVVAFPGTRFNLPLDVTNIGNGQSRIATSIEELHGFDGVDRPVPPPTFVIESHAQQGPGATVTKRVFLSLTMPPVEDADNRPASVLLRIDARYAGAVPSDGAGHEHATRWLRFDMEPRPSGPGWSGPLPGTWSAYVQASVTLAAAAVVGAAVSFWIVRSRR